MTTGLFLVIEGIDGCGKSTQAKMLVDYLTGDASPCHHLREPGSTGLGERVREILLQKETGEIDPWAETLLFMASRRELCTREIIPALQRGEIVVCERFHPSTICYQGAGLEAGMDRVAEIARLTTPEIKPDLVILLDLPVPLAMARVGSCHDRLEARGNDYMEMVRKGFLQLAATDTRMVVVDASLDPATVSQSIRMEVDRVRNRT